MGRFLPKSLLGQTMLAIGVALLITQLVAAALMYRAAENRMETALLNRVALNLLLDPDARGPRGRLRFDPGDLRGESPDGDRRGGRRLRTVNSPDAPLTAAERNNDEHAERLSEILLTQGVEPYRLQLAEMRAGGDPLMQELAERSPRFAARPQWANQKLIVAGIQFEPGGEWRVARVRVPDREPNVLGGIIFQTALLFIVLMAVLFLILRRITRPLATLTGRVADFSKNPDRAVMLDETGPADTRRLIAAHNAMEARIAALLDEKDVMLGAIGHDLKTPLAALRVRIESVPDDTQRAKMAASIEDIVQTLDDILSLARVGRNGGPAESIDLGAMAAGIVEEFEDLGQPVAMEDTPRIVATVQETWLKRALRNLVTNAVRYGGSAQVSLEREGGHIVLRVEDNGPGIPEGQIAQMLEPFTRGEASRNRATGGGGLGLTLARAIAEQHGGTLVLSNRPEGGLRAEIRLPA